MAVSCFSFLPAVMASFLLYPSVVLAVHLKYPAVFNFGDSNSDTGGLVSSLGEPLNPPNGETYFRKPAGRFCDGRLIVDFLMDAMDLPFLNPYLDAMGLPNFRRGSNFASAGCTIHPATATSVSPFSFGIQVAEFLRFKKRALELQGERLSKFLPQEEDFEQALYMFDIGQNDLAGAFFSHSEDEVISLIPVYLREFEKWVEKLYENGAKNFWIHNTGPLGCLPQNIRFFGKDPSRLDKHGCLLSHNHAAKIFNLQLHGLCRKLRGEFRDANITYFNVFAIKRNLILKHSRYGFEHPTTACCGYGGLPLNYDSRISCGQTKILNGTSQTTKRCDDPSEYISWDGIHYTEAANRHVASQILTGKYSDPSFANEMPFLLPIKF